MLRRLPNSKRTRLLTLTRGWQHPASEAVDDSFVRRTLPRRLCWTRRQGLMLRVSSPPVPPCRSSRWSPRSSEPSCCADFACPCHLPRPDAVAMHTSILAATTSLLARAPAFCRGRGAALSSVLLRTCAEKLGRRSPGTRPSGT